MSPRPLKLILGLSSVVVALLALPGLAAASEEDGVIGGTVTAEGTNEPLSEVVACAFIPETKGPARCASTDSEGHYSISRLREGKYLVFFRPAAPGKSERYVGEYFNDAEVEEDATKVDVPMHAFVVEIDAELTLGGAIAGTVFKPDGSRAADIYVCLTSAEEEEQLGCGQTDAMGEYEFIQLHGAFYKVEFSPSKVHLFEEGIELEEAVDDGYDTQWWKAAPTFSAATEIEVADSTPIENIDAHLTRPVPQQPPAPNLPAPNPPPVLTPPVLAPPAVTAPVVTAPVVTTPSGLSCRKGFHKTTVKGKPKCVKKHPKRRHPAAGKSQGS